jgi:hypothetical protein
VFQITGRNLQLELPRLYTGDVKKGKNILLQAGYLLFDGLQVLCLLLVELTGPALQKTIDKTSGNGHGRFEVMGKQ